MRLRLLLAVASLLFAGCTSSSSSVELPAPEPETPTQLSFAWELAGCIEVIAQFEVDSAALQEILPEGFHAGGGWVPTKTRVGIDAFQCAGEIGYSAFWAQAQAPSDLDDGAGGVYVKWHTMVANETIRAALAARGASVATGTVSINRMVPPVPGWHADILLEGSTPWSLDLGPETMPRGGAGTPARVREFATTNDPRVLVVWDALLASSSETVMPGYATVPPDSVPAQLFGSTTIPCLFSVGESEVLNGTINVVNR